MKKKIINLIYLNFSKQNIYNVFVKESMDNVYII